MAADLFTGQQCRDAIWPSGHEIPTKNIRCRHCQALNKVSVARAILNPDNNKCGKCQQSLFIPQDEQIPTLSSALYEHPLDHNYLDTLRAIPGFPLLVKWILGQVTDRSNNLELLASNIRCGDQQLPELVTWLNSAAKRLNIPKVPTLFLGESPFVNASTNGVENSAVVLQTALVDLLSPAELQAVMGHELGHLQSEHLLYHLLATIIINGSQFFTDIGRFLSTPLRLALLKWYRCSELTADRAALLATGSLPATLGMLIKLAGSLRQTGNSAIQLAPFIQQVRELSAKQDNNLLDSLIVAFNSMQRTHPHIAWRVMHLLDWVENGNYLNIIAGEGQNSAR